MTRYAIYLEIGEGGLCMAHAPDLPGCIVRAPGRDEALRRLPDAIRAYHAWLWRHGEPAPAEDEPVEIEVAGEKSGGGPFNPGDAAALLPPDRAPLTRDAMARLFRLMGHARADLLTLVRDLPEDVLNWKPAPEAFHIRRALRHVGNAEEWYVSRLVPPDTLPPEWEHDADMPIFDFLDMERRTVVERLERLTDAELSGVFTPANWTDHPDEQWTARKALRRALEHELEHTAQVREILAAWRRNLLARMAKERAVLLYQLIGLDEKTLTEPPVFDAWTAANLLAHIAAWDEWFTNRINLILAGREEEVVSVENLDARNAALHAERRGWPLAQSLDACVQARADFLAALDQLSDEELHRKRVFSWGEAAVREWAGWRARHDATHAAHLSAWRASRGDVEAFGPKEVLLAALDAARDELLTAASLVPVAERESRRVCGEWTLKDVLGHVADWELWFLRRLRQLFAGQAPDPNDAEDEDAWNRAHAEARRDQAWEAVWADFHSTHDAMMVLLMAMDQSHLNQRLFDWSIYHFVRVYADHDREHAAGIRKALDVDAT